jgi:hypothetical protein
LVDKAVRAVPLLASHRGYRDLSLCPSQYTVYKRVEGYGFSTIKSYEELYCFHLLVQPARSP